MTAKPTFRNIDVDIIGPAGGQALIRYFREHAVVLRDEPDGFSFEASNQHEKADQCVDALVSLIRALPDELASSWERSSERYFDVGYDAPAAASSVVMELSRAALQAMSEIGVRLRVTVYSSEPTIR